MTSNRFLTTALALCLSAGTFVAAPAFAQDAMKNGAMKNDGMSNEKTKMVGGAAMYPSKNIVENAVNSKDHTTLVAAVKAAGLVDTLQGKGPFTVFAPTNEAFAKLPTTWWPASTPRPTSWPTSRRAAARPSGRP
jgi:pentapeptide MXKDX repeat protein